MKLYMTPSSGNAYKVRVLLSILKLPCEQKEVDWAGKEHKSPAFLKLNPRGQVPVMDIENKVFWDSTAHLVYLARKHGGEQWLPTDPLGMAEVMQWMAFAQDEVQFGLQWARGAKKGMKAAALFEEYEPHARRAMDMLEAHLASHDWLALGRPTVADIAVYPYVKRAPDAGFAMAAYPQVAAWLARCEALPGWIPLD
jgi:glutathione S-transferase